MKKLKDEYKKLLLHLPLIIFVFALVCLLIANPQTASNGIRNGINLLLNTVIPSLFPFLVLSSYIAQSKSFSVLSKFFSRVTHFLFKMSPDTFIPIFMGLIGGYPIGAKVTAELFQKKRITQNEAERLMYFCVNSGPAFAITAVGVSMLSDYTSGILLYISTIASSLTLGILCRFLSDNQKAPEKDTATYEKEYVFINSVSSGSNAVINISAWILTFSCISALINNFNLSENAKLFLNSLSEVTSGCQMCSGKVSLPVISAILGFGGISVICQIAPYLAQCNVKLKYFLTARVLNLALSAFYTSQLLKLFPEAQQTAVIYSDAQRTVAFSYTVPATVILLLMCIILILQVDNRRKIC